MLSRNNDGNICHCTILVKTFLNRSLGSRFGATQQVFVSFMRLAIKGEFNASGFCLSNLWQRFLSEPKP
jgi:hypothetical protein